MQRNALKNSGGPHPGSCKILEQSTAEGIVYLNRDKDNSFRDHLLERAIACRPPNEDRLRGIA